MANENESSTENLDRTRTLILVGYNVLLALVMSLLLYQTILKAARAEAVANQKKVVVTEIKVEKKLSADENGKVKVDTSTIVSKDTLKPDNGSAGQAGEENGAAAEDKPASPPIPDMIRYVLWAISLAGGSGAALSNLRGIFEFSRDKTFFPAYLEMPFYVRPISGVICGLFTFFLGTFFAGALTAQGGGSGWQTLQGMFPYVGIAFMAGFASQEFMERLKETAKTLFGSGASSDNGDSGEQVVVQQNPVNTPPSNQQPPVTNGGGNSGGEESFNINDTADNNPVNTTPTNTATPPTPPVIVVRKQNKRRPD